MNGKQFIVATLFALVLLTVTFIPISSQQLGTYDPWLDINDDGRIDIKDLAIVARSYGTEGTPVNKTALLLELQSKVTELETKFATLNATKLGKPDYDSGWTPITRDQEITFNHGLGTTELLVYVVNSQVSNGINQRYSGGDTKTTGEEGVYWRLLTADSIKVCRQKEDYTADNVRVIIWKIATP